MSKKGQNTQKGIFAQNWASLSLFLQFLRDQNFLYIQIEPDQSEDFDLVFSDGKKVICESKYRLEKFSYPQLKELLEKIIKRGSIGDRDEILVVCRSVGDNLISLTKYVRYSAFRKQEKAKLLRLGFNDQLIELMPKVNFWSLEKVEDNELNYSLVAELINFWVPEDDIKRFTNNLLQTKISQKATTGSVYSRSDFNNDIATFRKEAQTRSDFFNKKNSKNSQFTKLEDDVNKGKGIKWGTGSVTAFSTRWDLMSFAMDRLKTRHDLDLKKWDGLWQLNRVYYFTFGIFHVFENNLQTDKNREYILSYIKKYTKTIRGFYRSDFFDVDVVKIVTKIIEGADGSKYLHDAFAIVADLITFNEKEFFYLKDTGHDRGEWEKGEICKLLHKIYGLADATLKQKVFGLIVSGFNVTEDDGEFIHHAPTDVYGILREWLDEDFKNRFNTIVKLASEQYQRYYRKFGSKIEFKGWEHMGGGTSFGPGGHHVGDRHFIGFILAPAIRKYYDANKTEGWKFIKQQCITATTKVSKARPDFLNRSVYEIVLSRYADSNKKISNEAFSILKEFILSRKGIPHKSDLIYQSIAGSGLLDDKKWKLVDLTVKKYGVPVNPFAEQIVADLAKKGYQPAKATLRQWFADPKYYKHFMFDLDSVSSIKAMLDSDLNFAAELFKALITSDYIKNGKSDHFGAYTVAALLNDIIRRDYNVGLSILRLLESEEKLSDDQQIIYSFSLFNHHGNDESDDQELLLKVYNEVVDPFLKKHGGDITKISLRLTDGNCREAFIQFAARLAAKKRMADALRIVRVFIDDPDPYLPGQDPHDPEDKYNEHKSILEGKEPSSIRSVRGWCGWVLMKCSILDGRGQVPEVIELTKKLISDQNYYTIHMACFALGQIARNRLTVLPSNRDILFFNDDQKTALEMAKGVEAIAFDLLDRLVTWPALVQKAMTKSVLHVFDPIRALNEQDSLKLVTALAKLPADVTEESAPLFIYYAEFRKNAYTSWRFGMPGLYDDLGPEKYDEKKFKKILIETIKELQKEDPDSCFRFASSVEHAMREASGDEIERNTELALEYLNLLSSVYAHNIFTLIYQVAERKLGSPDKYIDRWFTLLIKCLEIEKEFYEEQVKSGNVANVRWYPTLYHSRIMELINEKLGQDKFMLAAKIFFAFPKEIDLHESIGLVSAIEKIAKTDKDAKKIISSLLDKNPSKYWHLKNKTK
ncbi:MAG: Uncharacterized protein G01um101418_988 [Parcubacteria group bacterium Gr01-1014_18]|nr:MAG: Uncharacterized protein G01um101418_988 [Parcubacteria group bacterium Gr01-1014_18]